MSPSSSEALGRLTSPVYLIGAHHLPEQFHRLADSLKGSKIVAHIDASSPLEPFLRKDIDFAPRVKVTWGGYSQVRALVSLLKSALELHLEATHFVFLSGQDYPSRPIEDFESYLASLGKQSLLAHQDMRSNAAQFPNIPWEWCSLDLYDRFDIPEAQATSLLRRLPRRSIPLGWHPWRGSSFWCLSRRAADHVVATLESPRHRRTRRYFRTIRIPDEIAIPTILMNSELAPTIADSANDPAAPLHYIDWNPERENPALLDINDLPSILESNKFFVRKVEPSVSGELLEALDSRRFT